MPVRLHTNTETYQIHNYEQGSRMHVGLCVLNIAWSITPSSGSSQSILSVLHLTDLSIHLVLSSIWSITSTRPHKTIGRWMWNMHEVIQSICSLTSPDSLAQEESLLNYLPYTWLFWRALNLANWSENVIGEYKFGEYSNIDSMHVRVRVHVRSHSQQHTCLSLLSARVCRCCTSDLLCW